MASTIAASNWLEVANIFHSAAIPPVSANDSISPTAKAELNQYCRRSHKSDRNRPEVAVGKAGARNAAILAVQILALSDSRLRSKLGRYKTKLARRVEQKDRTLQKAEARRKAE